MALLRGQFRTPQPIWKCRMYFFKLGQLGSSAMNRAWELVHKSGVVGIVGGLLVGPLAACAKWWMFGQGDVHLLLAEGRQCKPWVGVETEPSIGVQAKRLCHTKCIGVETGP